MDQKQPVVIPIRPPTPVADEMPTVSSAVPLELKTDKQSINELSTELEKILQERRAQRQEMLQFVRRMATTSLYLLIGMIAEQSILRIFIRNYEAVGPSVFNVVAVSVFGQIIGLIVIIVKSLWDDSKYIDKM